MGRVTTLRSLTLGDVARLSLSVTLLPALYVAVSILPFARLRKGQLWLTERGRLPGSPDSARIVWAVATADRYLPGERKCLVRSLTTEAVMRLYGYDPTHRIGVDRGDDGGMKAHSWLEYEGEVIIGDVPNLDRYEPLPPLSAAAADVTV
jgi:hypothetical protein